MYGIQTSLPILAPISRNKAIFKNDLVEIAHLAQVNFAWLFNPYNIFNNNNNAVHKNREIKTKPISNTSELF